MVDKLALAQLHVAQDQAAAAWSAVTATWVTAVLSALVIGSAFLTIAWQRHLDREREERRRQYNNLSVLIESMLTINYLGFCDDYLGAAQSSGKFVSKYSILFYLFGYSRNLEISSAADDIGPGPTSVASRSIVIAREVANKVNAICANDTLSLDQIDALRAFFNLIEPDLATVWRSLFHHHANIVASEEGTWAEDEFCRRSRTPQGGRAVIDMLKAGRYIAAEETIELS